MGLSLTSLFCLAVPRSPLLTTSPCFEARRNTRRALSLIWGASGWINALAARSLPLRITGPGDCRQAEKVVGDGFGVATEAQTQIALFHESTIRLNHRELPASISQLLDREDLHKVVVRLTVLELCDHSAHWQAYAWCQSEVGIPGCCADPNVGQVVARRVPARSEPLLIDRTPALYSAKQWPASRWGLSGRSGRCTRRWSRQHRGSAEIGCAGTAAATRPGDEGKGHERCGCPVQGAHDNTHRCSDFGFAR